MLYSTTITINSIEYTLRIGLLQLIMAKRMYKINIMVSGEISDIENIIKLLHVCLKYYDGIPQDFDDFVEWLDNSDASIGHIAKQVTEAVNLGLHKKAVDKDKLNAIDAEIIEDEAKNL